MKKALLSLFVILVVAGGVYWYLDYRKNEFKDWQTYRNEQYGYEVMNPSDWVAYPSGFNSNNGFGTVQTYTIDSKQGAKVLLQIEDPKLDPFPNVPNSADFQQIKFNSYDAKRLGKNSDNSEVIAVPHNELDYTLYIDHGSDEKTLRKILSTFKFTK